MSPVTADGGVVELTREEGREMLGQRTQRMLGMSLEEFEAAYEADTLPDRSEVLHLIMLLPFAR
jgi:Lon protease-like protein